MALLWLNTSKMVLFLVDPYSKYASFCHNLQFVKVFVSRFFLAKIFHFTILSAENL